MGLLLTSSQPTVEVWTDGSCSAVDQVGGWSAILRVAGAEHIWPVGGYEYNTTSQRMELTALVGALKSVHSDTPLTVYSDSAYLINCIREKWVEQKWERNGWINSKGGPVANRELWELIHQTLKNRAGSVEFVKVKGHSGVAGNEAADQFAKNMRQFALDQLFRRTSAE